PALLDGPAVAVVGSRRATAYGRRTARALGAALARAEVVVVSGLALGVDGSAHEGAIAAGGRTLAVLGSGIDRPYPRANRELFRTLAREHLLVSEFLPGEAPLPHHFPKRNRILAALSRAVIVV
ncbi:MAG: DNA-protecting protein DprA, partial [Gemmatimonadetes bacterium]|nr:DNA-protecting protein DprA [Gemmatimonadota bacterium]NIR79816.1 DNA-protecting protein DprA [Gemmatimonadota bacterium]NIT88522.1 DNA-protecting protein DprA [Gemmatimonadota bacterium]NIU32345.1 DNA-protecting protein DprA [Gemmatimonadota bacterium]NIU36859.1 DNA-protecting protein DprA [Gemmatimonadota bacterium]